jgi:hypothetical protein
MYFKLERQSSDFYICGLFPINLKLKFNPKNHFPGSNGSVFNFK